MVLYNHQWKKQQKLTVISVYCACKPRIEDSGPFTAFTQQWYFMEGRGDNTIDVQKKMILDLTQFIKSLRVKKNKVVFSIDENKDFDPRRQRIATLVSEC